MWLRIKSRALEIVNHLQLSTKITLLYAAVLCFILVFTNILTMIGLYFSLYHQAEVEMRISMSKTLERIGRGERLNPGFLRDSPVLPGVVLRIIDAKDRVIVDNAGHYPSIREIEKHEADNPPFWADPDFKLVHMDQFSLYVAKVNVTSHNEVYTVYFLRTITAERHFLADLRRLLLVTNILGVIIALLAGYLVSRHLLHPIRKFIKTAKQVGVEDLNRRLEVPEVHDELRELAVTFNKMLARIEQGFNQQKRFVSDASHELRTPVTVIKGYSDLLDRWGSQDEAVLAEGIAAIRDETENMTALIEKLLFLARADQKRQVLHKQKVAAHELLADVMKKFTLVDQDHEIELLQNEQAFIFADIVVMRQMLRIFLENSMKYTPAGGRITLSSTLQEDKLLVKLQDTGIGIALEHQAKVFERFYRADTSRTRSVNNAGGTGLGLAIAQWIAGEHGIELQLASEVGRGTTITLLIPLLPAETEEEKK